MRAASADTATNGSTDTGVAEASFPVGSKIEARYRGKNKWYGGEVVKVHSNGTYDIRYEDGDAEQGVRADLVRIVAATSSFSARFEVGSKIEARYRGKKKWYAGSVSKVNDDGTFDVAYADGDVEQRVKAAFIRPTDRSLIGTASAETHGAAFRVDDTVFARKGGIKGPWTKGKVSAVHDDQLYSITYDDGTTENKVPVTLMTPVDTEDDDQTSGVDKSALDNTLDEFNDTQASSASAMYSNDDISLTMTQDSLLADTMWSYFSHFKRKEFLENVIY